MKITLSHGSGGKATSELIDKIFARSFSNPILNMMEDSAVVLLLPCFSRAATSADWPFAER